MEMVSDATIHAIERSIADEGWPRLLNAWCAIVLAVCAVKAWYRIESEANND